MRHFCANPAMSEEGEYVGGLLGFIRGLGDLCDKFSPEKVIVVWESEGNLRKRSIASSYKDARRPVRLNRYYEDDIPATPDNYNFQLSLLVKVMGNLPVTQIYVRNTEADDVIAYLSKYKFPKKKIIIASSDKDLHQLITSNVVQWSPGQKKIIDADAIIEKFGVTPENFISARSFVGDTSDNIPGIKGVGFKSLSKWFPQLRQDEFISVSEIVHLAKESLGKNATINRIAESLDDAKRNWSLMHLDTNQLAGVQVHQLENQLENIGKANKIALLRLLIHNGMGNFSIDHAFHAIVATTR